MLHRGQAREMETQSRLLTKSVEGSNLLRLIVDVLDEDARHGARKRIMMLWNERVPLAEWTEADRRDGERVIRTFDLMGLMVKRELLDWLPKMGPGAGDVGRERDANARGGGGAAGGVSGEEWGGVYEEF